MISLLKKILAPNKMIKDNFFIQIGANVGNNPQDIIWPLVQKEGWKGILIEPLYTSFEKLKLNYSNIQDCYFENIAIADYDGEITLLYDADGDSQVASVVNHHSPDFNQQSIKVPCLTLESLVKKYELLNTKFELLQIDAESYDHIILTSTDFKHILPKYIRFEYCHLSRDEHHPTDDKRRDDRLKVVLDYLAKFGYSQHDDIFKHSLYNEKNTDILVKRG